MGRIWGRIPMREIVMRDLFERSGWSAPCSTMTYEQAVCSNKEMNDEVRTCMAPGHPDPDPRGGLSDLALLIGD
jgi:hypothetical protein